jgi:hypothetical protein
MKEYYVFGHEKPSTIEYWKSFCKQYQGYEARMHHRVTVKGEVAKNRRRRCDCWLFYNNYYEVR